MQNLTKAHRFAFVMGGLFVLAFSLPLLYFFFLGPFLSYVHSFSWTETPCVILESGVYSTGSSSSSSTGRTSQPTYRPQYTYAYTVNGREYRSDRYTFFFLTIDGEAKASREAAEHPVGSRTVCYVDPQNPGEAVFTREFRAIQIVGLLFPGLFLAMGVGAVVAGLRPARKHIDKDGWQALPPADAEAASALGGNAVTLKPTRTPWSAFITGIFWTIAWNGVLAFIGYVILQETLAEYGGSIPTMIREGGPQLLRSLHGWLWLLIPSPFVLIGLLMIAGIPYQFLALFNPRPRLSLSTPTLTVGESAQLHWQLSSSGRIQQLTITLQKRELRNPQSLRPIVVQRIVDVRSPDPLEAGTATVRIPLEAWPSAEARRYSGTLAYAAVWTIRLQGDIRLWPDVDAEYTVTVEPPAQG